MPQTFKIVPKWQNFAKSGHTADKARMKINTQTLAYNDIRNELSHMQSQIPYYFAYSLAAHIESLQPLNQRALYNRINFLHYIIPPPILGAFYNKEKIVLFIVIEQAISQ